MEFEELLELWREVRNAIHNNMVYWNSSGDDKSLRYRGREYVFRVGRPLDFITFGLLVGSMARELGVLLDSVVRAEPLVAVDRIFDPANGSVFEQARRID